MRDDLHQKVMSAALDMRLNVLREILQWEVISALHQGEAFNTIAFIGGTSLRLLHGLGRFSENLEFSSIEASVDRDRLNTWGKDVKKRLEACALSGIEFTIGSGTGALLSADIRVAGILKEVELSPMESQKLRIKIKVDTNPPEGAKPERLLTTTPDRRILAVGSHDLESLMARQVHSLLSQPFTQGRYWYDLIWCCVSRVTPNMNLLENMFRKMPSRWCGKAENWRKSIRVVAGKTDWQFVKDDAAQLIEDSTEATLLNEETVKIAL